MMFANIINKFQNYTYNSTCTISEYLTVQNNKNSLNEDDIMIQEYLLPEILTLTNKAILNKMSSDLLFQYNYWSWGFVSIYYSNFYLAQTLKRIKGNFYTRVGNIEKEVQFLNNKYELTNVSNGKTHEREFQKLRENYLFLRTDSNYNKIIPDDYSIRPFYSESNIRNKINYQLFHYKEFERKFYGNLSLKDCKLNYNNDFSIDEFKLVEINSYRFKFLFYILNQIKLINDNFEVHYDKLINVIDKEFNFVFNNDILKHIEHKFKRKIFHIFSKDIINEIVEVIK